MIEAHAIEKSFGSADVLRGVDICIRESQITAVIGPSGGGKSTLLRALSLLDPPTSGRIVIDGHLYEFPQHNREQFVKPWPKLTVVFQQLFLWPHLTLRHNILLPVQRKITSETIFYLERLIELLDMGEFIDRFPNTASLGQRQRAALARALVLRPKYLLLDEITSSLDVEQISAVLSHLQKLREEGTGILIVTHLLGFARNAADWIVFLDEGRVLEADSPQLLDNPTNNRVRKFLALVEAAG